MGALISPKSQPKLGRQSFPLRSLLPLFLGGPHGFVNLAGREYESRNFIMSEWRSLRMGISAFIVISVYVGPSIVIGGTGQFFAHPARASFVAVAVIAVVVSLFRAAVELAREDRSNRWIFIPVGVITVTRLAPVYGPKRSLDP